jgi:hypothetical protein
MAARLASAFASARFDFAEAEARDFNAAKRASLPLFDVEVSIVGCGLGGLPALSSADSCAAAAWSSVLTGMRASAAAPNVEFISSCVSWVFSVSAERSSSGLRLSLRRFAGGMVMLEIYACGTIIAEDKDCVFDRYNADFL